MKVGTDAVMLGAWAMIGNEKRILDVGTGSGVIALMLAQRSRAETRVDAVELRKEDALQALENRNNSPWPEKIFIIPTGIQEHHPDYHYDHIVCNPPFFSKSLLPPTEHRSQARHDATLTSAELLSAVVRLLSPAGKFSLILPPPESEVFTQKANLSGLFLHRLTRFFTRPGKPQERSLMEFGFALQPADEDEMVLYASGNRRTEKYRELTGEFYEDPRDYHIL
jgi:tRNA1Val (adenine37-N6)-methyltransferase